MLGIEFWGGSYFALLWYIKDATPMRRLLIYTISNEKFDVIFVPLHIKYLFPPLADFFLSTGSEQFDHDVL